MRRDYNLGFISNEDIYNHVRDITLQYRRSINLREFNKNIIDPIKMTFDAKIYGQTWEEAIKAECIRQIDKSNNNCVGYFHQYIFRYAGNGWIVPENGEHGGFDVINDERHIYVELKNKHNTMNSASSSDTYIKMQDKLLRDSKATCMLVEVIAKHSQNITWEVTVNKNGHRERYSNEKIRRVSIDLFYEIVFGDKKAFFKLCQALPTILDDVLQEEDSVRLNLSVYDELGNDDLLRSLYLLAFDTYEGFGDYGCN